MSDKKLNYDESVREIEEILSDIENGKMGVDELTEKVARVSALLKDCREKLTLTEKQVRDILSTEETEDSSN